MGEDRRREVWFDAHKLRNTSCFNKLIREEDQQ
jgi:hypothetical protein